MFYVSLTDLKEYRISNELVIVIGGLFFLYEILLGRWVSIHWNVGFALLMFAIMLLAYTRKLMGGGDLKILTVAFLWVGVDCALLFAILLFICSAVITFGAKLGWIGAQAVNGRIRIAFAPAVAGALIGTFVLGCLGPLPSTSCNRQGLIECKAPPHSAQRSRAESSAMVKGRLALMPPI